MNLRVRLNLVITLLILVFMGAMCSFAVREIRVSVNEGVEAAMQVTVQLLDNVIVSSFYNPDLGYTHDVLKHFLERLGRVRSVDVQLFAADGQLLYQSPTSTFALQVRPPGWFDKMVRPKPIVVVRYISYGRLVIRSSPQGAMREYWSNFRNLFWLGVTFFVLLNVIVYWFLGRALRPFGEFIQEINRLERGDLSARLPAYDIPEFGRIANNFNSMADSLEKSTEENRRMGLLVQQTSDAVIIHDKQGNISFWNPAAERMFGYTASDMMGKPAALLYVEQENNARMPDFAMTDSTQTVDAVPVQCRARNGEVLSISLSASPLIDPHTEDVIGTTCVMRDMTQYQRIADRERELAESRSVNQQIQTHLEDDRRSLSRELHDELGQYVTAVKSFATAIANQTHDKTPIIEAHAKTIIAAADHIYAGMHSIIKRLRPGALDNLGLVEALRDAFTNWQQQHAHIQFQFTLSGDLNHLGETLNINLYRIVQEAVTNIIRHAHATVITVVLECREECVQLEIRDNGHGFDVQQVDQTEHFGLLGMRERVQSLQGRFHVHSEAGQGCMILVQIPASASFRDGK